MSVQKDWIVFCKIDRHAHTQKRAQVFTEKEYSALANLSCRNIGRNPLVKLNREVTA